MQHAAFDPCTKKHINDPDYRQNIQRALNRTELYHYLTGEVGYANRGKIMAKTAVIYLSNIPFILSRFQNKPRIQF